MEIGEQILHKICGNQNSSFGTILESEASTTRGGLKSKQFNSEWTVVEIIVY